MTNNYNEVVAALENSENRYRILVELSPFSIITLDEVNLVFANPAAAKLLKAQSPDELIGKSFIDILDPAKYTEFIHQVKKLSSDDESPSILSSSIKSLDGSWFDAEMIIGKITYNKEKLIHIILNDVSGIKYNLINQKIEQAIIEKLIPAHTIVEALDSVLKTICDQLKLEVGMIWTVDMQNDNLRCTTAWQSENIKGSAFIDLCHNSVLEKNAGIAGKAWAIEDEFWVDDLKNFESPKAKLAQKYDIDRALAFPIFYGKNIYIIIELIGNNLSKHHKYISATLAKIGAQICLFLRNKQVEDELSNVLQRDFVTGYYNRYFIEKTFSEKVLEAKQSKICLSIMTVAIDNFHLVIDSLGYRSGDMLLKDIAHRIGALVEGVGYLSRIDSNKFIVLFYDFVEEEEIKLVQDIIQIFANPFSLQHKSFHLHASIGVSIYPSDGEDINVLLINSDLAASDARNSPLVNFAYYNQEMTVKAQRYIYLDQNLQHALEKGEFIVYYQPKVDVKTKMIVGMEALLRWQLGNELILPEEFIPIAEDNGTIINIGKWVLQTACDQAHLWHEQGLSGLTIAVNLSVSQFNDADLVNAIEKALSKSKLLPQYLELELTESVLIQHIEKEVPTFQALKKLGVKISLDDFGTGYSSFNYLRKLVVNTLKIDSSFIMDLEDQHVEIIVSSMIVMAKKLGMTVVAEGVETEHQLSKLVAMDCDQVQGYIFSRAQDAHAATILLLSYAKDAN